ncbi:MAG: hypothetical protein L6W00_02465 [Lentisphaeria bacterium]|nr:MAG: hypothetical protein L6W00_02465 [Lentisphaeria bacterium]
MSFSPPPSSHCREATAKASKREIRRELEARRSREPGGRSAGCTFRNISEFEPAGRLIEQCGFKEYRVGGLEVSAAHANYVVNVDSGTERDYLELLREIRTAVAEKFGFYLRPEVKFVNPSTLETLLAAPVPPKVNVLEGGTSREREISLKSGAAVAQALRNAGFDVTETDLQKCCVTPEMREADVVYPVLHGGFGEDGRIQREMEDAGLKFVGSGSAACLLVMDKIATKRLADQLGLPHGEVACRHAGVAGLPRRPETAGDPQGAERGLHLRHRARHQPGGVGKGAGRGVPDGG